jgi:hypothetical protein
MTSHPQPGTRTLAVAPAHNERPAFRGGPFTASVVVERAYLTDARPSSAIACSRSLNFCTLPVTVIGNASTQRT